MRQLGLDGGHRRTRYAPGRAESGLCYPSRARWSGHFSAMPNIKQQKKRVRTAAEERLENLRYRSTIKTLAKRLSTSVEAGDTAATAEEHKELVKLIDRAVSRGALHKNAGARKKSQAAKIAAGGTS
jgi:small subunit ribosomal protein S20